MTQVEELPGQRSAVQVAHLHGLSVRVVAADLRLRSGPSKESTQ